MEHKSNGDSNCNWLTWSGSQRLGKEARKDGHLRTNRDHPNNTEKIAMDRRRLVVTRSLLRDLYLALMWEACKKCNNNKKKKLRGNIWMPRSLVDWCHNTKQMLAYFISLFPFLRPVWELVVENRIPLAMFSHGTENVSDHGHRYIYIYIYIYSRIYIYT